MSTSRRQTPARSRNTTAWVVGGVVAVVALIGLGVVLLAGGDDEGDDGATGGSGGAATVPADVEQNRPVTVTGTPLAPLEGESDPAIGTTAPVVDGASFDGTPVTIDAGGTDYTMVVVLAHWCPHCNAEIPRLIELQETGRLPENLRIVGVSTSVASDAPNYPPSSWIVDKGWPWEVLADSESQQAAVAYGVSGFPFVTVYDPSGAVTARWSGESSVDELAERIDAATGS